MLKTDWNIPSNSPYPIHFHYMGLSVQHIHQHFFILCSMEIKRHSGLEQRHFRQIIPKKPIRCVKTDPIQLETKISSITKTPTQSTSSYYIFHNMLITFESELIPVMPNQFVCFWYMFIKAWHTLIRKQPFVQYRAQSKSVAVSCQIKPNCLGL